MANTTKTIEQILAADELTAYEVFRLQQAATLTVDPVRAASLRPQMVYNYSRNGLIVKGRKNVHRYTVSEAAAWIAKWTKKNLGTGINILSTAPKQHTDNAAMQSASRG